MEWTRRYQAKLPLPKPNLKVAINHINPLVRLIADMLRSAAVGKPN